MQQGLPEAGNIVAGKYTIEGLLGRGGMGVVYVVSHRLTGKRFALKCLLPEFHDSGDIVERFVREAQAMGRIQHRHVVDVFDVGRDGELLYIVMELLEGKQLSDLLHDEAMTLEETLGIVLRAMEGIAAAHAQGIVHRDLKPDNIFVCVGTSGRLDDPRVLDFGISKLQDDAAHRLTRSGVAMGTPYYMSLEQMSGERDVDHRADVYAMGVILYEAIAGHPPYTADSVSALAIRVLTTPPLHLGLVRPDLPAGLADVVMTAMARDRDQRYPTMHALIDALRPYVPKSSGMLVAEGQGRPLRTPRGGASSNVASDATLPALGSTPSAVKALSDAPKAAIRAAAVSGAAATNATTGAPQNVALNVSARVPAVGLSTTPVPAPRSPWLLVGAVCALVLGLGAIAYWSRATTSTPISTVEVVSPPAPPVPSAPTAVDEPASPAAAAAPQAPTSGTADALPTGIEAPSAPAVRSESGASDRQARRDRSKAAAAAKPDAPGEQPPAATPTPSQTAPAGAVRGRAGELGSDEF